MRSSPGLGLAKPVTVAAGEPAAVNCIKGSDFGLCTAGQCVMT